MGEEYTQGYRDGWNAALDEAEAILMGIMARKRGVIQSWGGNGTTDCGTITDDSATTRTEDGGDNST